jgi:hypothetical protein
MARKAEFVLRFTVRIPDGARYEQLKQWERVLYHVVRRKLTGQISIEHSASHLRTWSDDS